MSSPLRSQFVLAALAVIYVSCCNAAYFPNYYLDEYCGRQLTISCPYTYTGRSGTLKHIIRLPSNCNVNVSLDSYCGSSWNTYAIYLNIKKAHLSVSDSINIYEGGLLVKRIPGGSNTGGNSYPQSVGQLLSSYKWQPSLSINFTRGSSAGVSPDVEFEYTIVYGDWDSGNTRCSALNGYVNDDYICYGDSKVTCPSSYRATPSLYNYATANQDCETSTKSSFAGLEAGAIAGIVIGVVAGVFFITILIAIVARRSSARRRTVVQQGFVANQHTAVPPPVIVGSGYYPQPVGTGPTQYPQQAYYGAPPPYPAGQAMTGPAPYPAGSGLPEPPKAN